MSVPEVTSYVRNRGYLFSSFRLILYYFVDRALCFVGNRPTKPHEPNTKSHKTDQLKSGLLVSGPFVGYFLTSDF